MFMFDTMREKKNKSTMKAVSAVFVSTALLWALPLFGAEFTADSRINKGGRTAAGTFYSAGDRWRIEEHRPKGEYRVTIFKGDEKSLIVFWPDKKRYIKQPLPEAAFKAIASRKPGKELSRTKQGLETVAGYRTTKYRVTYDVQGKKMTSIEWFSKKLDTIIKSEAEDASWSSELSNIREGRLDKGLFEIPAGYKELAFKDVFKSREDLAEERKKGMDPAARQ